MRRSRNGASELSNHPFRSMFDLMLALLFFLVLVIIMMVPKNRHLDFIEAEDFMQQQIKLHPLKQNPLEPNSPEYFRLENLSTLIKKDPIGRQRWTFKKVSDKEFFMEAPAKEGNEPTLTLPPEDRAAVIALAKVLKPYVLPQPHKQNPNQKWLRIEGHTGEVKMEAPSKPTLTLTPEGQDAVIALAGILKPYGPPKLHQQNPEQKWFRIDIEGHTGEVKDGTSGVEPWEKSVTMAIAVAHLFSRYGLPPNVLKVSGKGRQDEKVIKGDRVEIIIEYSNTSEQ